MPISVQSDLSLLAACRCFKSINCMQLAKSLLYNTGPVEHILNIVKFISLCSLIESLPCTYTKCRKYYARAKKKCAVTCKDMIILRGLLQK